uniref:Ovule protein n=1 Tax=Caenorhabditis tropicalis TaxID=1561998 RepID=A0A1I7U6H2_9PELO
MMNSPSDSVEFYATNRKVSDEVTNGADDSELKKFTEVKQKDVVSYTEDGRKMINGKLVDEKDAPTMWSSALLRGRIRTIGAPLTEKEKKEEREKVRRNSKKLGKTIAVVASFQTLTSNDVIGQESDVPQPVEITPVTVVGSCSPPK